MKIYLLNTHVGLKPMYDSDYDEKKKLTIGKVYVADIKEARNLDFLRKAHSLVNTAWAYLPEKQTEGFRTVDNFRKYVTVAAGFCDVYYSPRLREWVEIPRSWNFSSMSESEFQDLYEGIKRVIFSIIGRFVTEEEFMNNLIDY